MNRGEESCQKRLLVQSLHYFHRDYCRVPSAAAEPQLLELTGELGVHDPVMIKAGDTYYLFATGGRRGRGIMPIHTSHDMREWTRGGFAFEQLPDWVADEVPRARNAWAPDISFFNGKYHLYYSLSSFGVNHSAIGLATNTTLDPSDPNYKWVDQGMVVRSRAGRRRFQRDRSQPGHRRRQQCLAFVGQLLGRNHDAARRSANRKALHRRHDAAQAGLAARASIPSKRRRSKVPSKRRSSSAAVNTGICLSPGTSAAAEREATIKSSSAARRRSPARIVDKDGKAHE